VHIDVAQTVESNTSVHRHFGFRMLQVIADSNVATARNLSSENADAITVCLDG